MRSLGVIATLYGLSAAWMPGVDRNIYSKEGANLFKRISPITKRTLPTSGKIRGVNLGSLFVFEPWIAENTWSNMGCGNQASEFDCVVNVGQAAANTSFSNHWDSWIVEEDFINMTTYGLNTVRIPVGYWLREDIVYTDSEHFSQGGLSYLEQVCGWASDHGLYIIIDLHGAPGAQVAQNSDTGQYASSPGFYVEYQFERALEFLEWMTTNIHTNNNFRSVGMLEIANEPVQDPNSVGELTSSYYPNAFTRIRAAEAALNISQGNELHIEMMNEKWGSGDPTQYLTDNWYAAYDDHRYLKWDSSVPVTPDDYLNTSCNDDRGGNWPTIVGEWSLSPPDDVQWNSDWDPSTNQAFYQKWFAAQVMTYEKQEGWVFWSWKSELGDYRWSYQDAVAAGVIPTDLDSLYNLGVC